ncbi:MAG: 3-keto-disaccharide hydrolase, partial [Planctomycetota bacterium]
MNCTTILTAIVGTAPVLALAPTVHADGDRIVLTPAEKAAGWVMLFDGVSTDALRGYQQAAFPAKSWKVENGLLAVSGGGGDIITKQQFENFELILEWKASKGANSGIMYRVTEEPGPSYASGPEFQILDDAGYGQGIDRLAGNSAGACYDLYPPTQGKVLHPAGEFNHARIIMRDGVVKHYLNGVKIVEADLNGEEWKSRVQASKFRQWPQFGTRAVGHIAIQDHGNPLWFRNIRIRDLDTPGPGEIDLL